MQDLREIKAEISKIVNDTIEAGAIGNVQFFTAKVMAEHSAIEGDDADFYLICAREVVVNEVKRAIGKYDKPEIDTPLMEGFEHLRTAYPVHRGGDHLLVPIDQMTDEEIDERCAQFKEASDGYIRHIEEFQTFKRERAAKKAGQGLLTG